MKEYELYNYTINRLFCKGEQELIDDIANKQHEVKFTEKQKYFIGKMNTAFEHAYYISKDIESGSILWEVGKGIILTAAVAGASKAATDLLGYAQFGNIVGFTTGVLAGVYSIERINSELDAKEKAKKIVAFLENTTPGAPDFGTIIACELYLEFRLSIEMLVKADEGIDILIQYFVKTLLEIIGDSPKSQLEQKKSIDDKLDYLKSKLTLGKIPKTELRNQGYLTSDLNWNLQELLRHSPIVVCTPIDRTNTYKFVVYINDGETKRRKGKKVSAEDSHKYPPRVVYSQQQAIDLPGYTRDTINTRPLPEHCCVIPEFETKEGANEFHTKSIDLFFRLRDAKRNPNNEKKVLEALAAYLDVANMIGNVKCSTPIEWFCLFIEIEAMRNIYWSVLVPINNIYKEENSNNYQKLFTKCKESFDSLSLLYQNEQRVNNLLKAAEKACTYFFNREDTIPTIRHNKRSLKMQIQFLRTLSPP